MSINLPSDKTKHSNGGAWNPDPVSFLSFLDRTFSKPSLGRSAAENAKIDKCLKNYSGKTYESKHGKIGFFFRTLSNIAKDYIDAPAYQCHSITTSKQIFLSFLRLRKTCQKKTNEWKKKTGHNYDTWEEFLEEKKERKAENGDRKRARKEKKRNRTR